MKHYDHTHKYERSRLGSFKKSGHEVYRCVVPGCNHYVVDMVLVVGRYSQCWGKIESLVEHELLDCPNEVEMTRYIVFKEKIKHPTCDTCKEIKRQQRKFKKDEQNAQLMEERMKAIEKLMELPDAKILDEQ